MFRKVGFLRSSVVYTYEAGTKLVLTKNNAWNVNHCIRKCELNCSRFSIKNTCDLCNYFLNLFPGISKEAICALLALAAGASTIVGGLGGVIYTAFFSCLSVVILMLSYYLDAFYNWFNRPDHHFPQQLQSYHLAASCTSRLAGNDEEGDLLTFFSRGGMLQGILFALSESMYLYKLLEHLFFFYYQLKYFQTVS